MTIPKVSVQDLIGASSNSTSAPSAQISHPTVATHGNPIGNFIDMLANYASQAGQGLEDAATSPVRDIAAYVKTRLDPVASKRLDAVNNNANLNDDQQLAQRQQIMQQHGGSSPEQQASAELGSNLVMGSTAPAGMPNMEGVDIPGSIMQGKAAVSDVANNAVNTAKNVKATMEAAPGGLQAGHINLGADISKNTEDIPNGTILDQYGDPLVKPKVNTTASMIKDETGKFIPNPNKTVEKPQADFGYNNIATEETPVDNETINPPPGKAANATSNAVEDPGTLPKGPGRTIARIELKPSVYGAGNEAQVQSTINNYVPGKTAEEQYNNLESTLENFGKQIDYQIHNNPQTTTLHDMMNTYDKNLEDAGIYRTTTSSKGAVQQAAQKYVRSLTGISDDEGNITSQALADSLQKVNKDAGPVFKKIENGTGLSAKDEAILAARQTVRDTLVNMYGGIEGKGGVIDDLLKKQGDLYDAAEPLFKARKAGGKSTGFFGKAKNFGIGAAGLGIAAKELGLNPIPAIQTGLGAIEHGISNVFKPNPNTNGGKNGDNNINDGENGQSNLNHGSSLTQFDPNVNSPASIPQSQDKIQQNPDGTFGIANIYSMKDPADPSGKTPLFVSPENIKSQQLAIDAAKNTLLYKNSQEEQARVGQLQDQLNTQKDFTNQIQQPYATAQIKNNAYSQAIKDAIAAAPDIANFTGSYDQFIQQLSPKFANLKTQLLTLEKEGAVNPNGIIKGSTLPEALQTAARGNLMNFYGQLNNITGFTGQGSSNIQTTRTLPVTPEAIPQNFNIGGGSIPSLSNLPSVNNMPAQ